MKALNTIKFVFAIIGGACLFAAAYLLISEIDFKRHAVNLNGVVVGFRGTGIGPAYSYEYPPGTPRQKSSNASSSSWAWMDGDSIPLQVDARNPDRVQIRGFVDQWFAATMMGSFGFIFGSIGFGIIYYGFHKERTRRYLVDRGTKVRARISSIREDERTIYNGRHPFIVHAEAQIDGSVCLFDSEHILFDPGPYLESGTVEVYYDPRNPGKYHVDLSNLPKVKG